MSSSGTPASTLREIANRLADPTVKDPLPLRIAALRARISIGMANGILNTLHAEHMPTRSRSGAVASADEQLPGRTGYSWLAVCQMINSDTASADAYNQVLTIYDQLTDYETARIDTIFRRMVDDKAAAQKQAHASSSSSSSSATPKYPPHVLVNVRLLPE
jgi:hypothetical protein